MNEKYQNDIVASNNRRTFDIRFIRLLLELIKSALLYYYNGL